MDIILYLYIQAYIYQGRTFKQTLFTIGEAVWSICGTSKKGEGGGGEPPCLGKEVDRFLEIFQPPSPMFPHYSKTEELENCLSHLNLHSK